MKPTKAKQTQPVNDGVWVYLGPSIRGVIMQGSIFRGSEKDKVLARVNDPEHVKRLLIRDVDLAEAKQKLKNGGNSLSVAYEALLTAKK